MKDIENRLNNLSIYIHYIIIQSYLTKSCNRQFYEVLSFEDFCNKPCDPQTSTTKLYEWNWKFPNIIKTKQNTK